MPKPLTAARIAEHAETVKALDAIPAELRTASRELLAEVERLRARNTELESDAQFLAALQAMGVDNWDGYDEACELLD